MVDISFVFDYQNLRVVTFYYSPIDEDDYGKDNGDTKFDDDDESYIDDYDTNIDDEVTNIDDEVRGCSHITSAG